MLSCRYKIPVDHGHAAAAGHVRHAAPQPSGRITAVDNRFGEVPAVAEENNKNIS